MTQQMTDDWKARQENLDAIGYDAVLTADHDEPAIDDEATIQTIFELFETLPLDRATALLEKLGESIKDNDYADDDIPFPIAWIDGEPVYRQ